MPDAEALARCAKVRDPGSLLRQALRPAAELDFLGSLSLSAVTFAIIRRGTQRRRLGSRVAWQLLGALANYAVWRFLRALRGFRPLKVNPRQYELTPLAAEANRTARAGVSYGDGCIPFRSGEWRPYLMPFKPPRENLQELCAIIRLKRPPEKATLEQLGIAIRHFFFAARPEFQTRTGIAHMCTANQACEIARALLADNGVADPEVSGGLEEVMEPQLAHFVPLRCPQWVDVAHRTLLGGVRAFFHMCGFQSKYVDTPYGSVHVYDSGEPEGLPKSERAPPVLLQHGCFVTGWSMMLLGLLLCRRRRVLVPDLLGFEYGYSRRRAGCAETPSVDMFADSVTHVLAHLGVAEVDLIGHSFGGFLVPMLPDRLQRQGIATRRIVLLNPAGNGCKFFGSSMQDPQLFLKPVQLAGVWRLLQTPISLGKKLAFSVLFSANNVSIMSSAVQGYFDGFTKDRVLDMPTLLLWGQGDKIAEPRDEPAFGAYMRQRFPRLEGHWILPDPVSARFADEAALGFLQHNLNVFGASTLARHIENFLGDPDSSWSSRGPGERCPWLLRALLALFTERGTRPMWDHDPSWTLEPAGPGALTAKDAIVQSPDTPRCGLLRRLSSLSTTASESDLTELPALLKPREKDGSVVAAGLADGGSPQGKARHVHFEDELVGG